EVVDLRLLIEVRGGRELQLVARVLREGLLDVVLVGFAPCALGTDRDEADGRQFAVAPARGARSVVAARACGEAERERAGGSDAESAGEVCACRHDSPP